MIKELIDVLERVCVLNRDDGSVFTVTDRLDAIASLLRGSAYKRVDAAGLFHMYARRPAETLRSPVVLVSSHVDCERGITKCFSRRIDENTLLGTYDNAITNAAIVYLMRSGLLPDDVLIAFTGDEEENSRGAEDVVRFLRRRRLEVRNIVVLDVTSEGWETGADFTVENDFWEEDHGERLIALIRRTGCQWNYVPGDPDDIPDFIPKDRIIPIEAYSDESWDYDEADLPCFSFCLPTKGEMHADAGILARAGSFRRYTEVLGRLLTELR